MNSELHLDNQNPSDSDPLLDDYHANVPPSWSEILKNGIDDQVVDDDGKDCSVPCCRICLECDGDNGKTLATFCY